MDTAPGCSSPCLKCHHEPLLPSQALGSGPWPEHSKLSAINPELASYYHPPATAGSLLSTSSCAPLLHSSNIQEPTRNSFSHPDICHVGAKHLCGGNQQKENPGVRLSQSGASGLQGYLGIRFLAVLSAGASPSAQHRPGAQLVAPSMISKWKDKHRKFVVMVVPAKSLTESWSGKELQNNAGGCGGWEGRHLVPLFSGCN